MTGVQTCALPIAARLTGWKIDIISATEYEKEKVERDKEIKAALAEEAEAQRLQEEARQAARAEEAEESKKSEESVG